MYTEIEVIQQPQQAVMSIRTRTSVDKLPGLIGQGYGAIMGWLQELGEAPVGMPFVAYYNMDMQDLDVEIGFPVGRALTGKGEVQPGAIPDGRVASCTYTGPYEQMAPAYEALTQWVQEHGYVPSGISYEHYLNSPADCPPEGLQTRIVFPLK
ncbi:MAG TPA: GyrI-like domain-containing protein [Anaerolineaceae bacterium]